MDHPPRNNAAVKEVFSGIADATTHTVSANKLYSLLRALNLPCDHRSIVQVQGQLRFLDNNKIDCLDQDGSGVDFPLFWRWYKLETNPGVYEMNNELLVRAVIERPKLPTRNLKEGYFIYGQKNIPDAENAGQVMLNWRTGERSKSKEAGVSLLKVNKSAVAQKLTSAKEVNRFLREHKNDKCLQRPKVVGKKKDQKKIAREAMKVAERKALLAAKPKVVENFSEILFPARTNPRLGKEETPYTDTSGQRRKGKLPVPKLTKSAELLVSNHRAGVKLQTEVANATAWKMSKFRNVPQRIVRYQDTRRGGPGSAAGAGERRDTNATMVSVPAADDAPSSNNLDDIDFSGDSYAGGESKVPEEPFDEEKYLALLNVTGF
jgi:hypothetical protein